MNHLYEVETGRLLSSTVLGIVEMAEGRAVKVSENTGAWNEETLDFEPIPVKNVIDKLEFLDRFTDVELSAILDLAETNSALKVFIKKLDLANSVDFASENTIKGLAKLEEFGLIGAGRAEAITNG